ncbi:MAG: hypothetical protein WCS93_06235 [Candidatus Delongbacteria bacterium]
MKKIAILAMSVLAFNLFALDINGLWELDTDDTTFVNENLHILAGGTVQPYNSHRTLIVNGSITVDWGGTIQNHPSIGYLLTVVCTGNIINNGTITNNTVKLSGSGVQILHSTYSTPISPSYFIVENPIQIEPNSDVYFQNSIITFPNGGGFDLTDGFGLIIWGGYLDGATITGDATQFPKPYLQMEYGAIINNSVCQDLSYWETITVAESVVFEGVNDNRGIIKPAQNAHRTITITDNFTNTGTFEDTGAYQMLAVSTGFFRNNGTINNYEIVFIDTLVNNATMTPYFIRFDGTLQQHITATFAGRISATYTSCSNPNGIIATSDLYFENSLINFSGYPIEISNGCGLYITGGYMNRMDITGKGIAAESVSNFEMSGGCYMQNTKLTDLILHGTIEMADDNCTLEGDILNYATIQNKSWNTQTLTVNSNFYNSGTITNNSGGYSLYFNFNGTDLHNGNVWTNQMLTLSGTAVQNLSNSFGYPFSPAYTSSSNLNGIIAKSDIEFENSLINFSGYELDLTEGRDLSVSGGYINRLILTGAADESEFEMSNGCYIQNSTLTDVVLRGTIDICEDNNIIEGEVSNYATIQNKSWYWYSVTINGDFKNYGTVTDNPGGYNLTLNFNGYKLTNHGTLNNYYTNFTGTSEQQIVFGYGRTIDSPEIYFKTDLATAPHVWHYNNLPIEATNTDFSYSDTQNLRWNIPVSETYFGSFYCETGEGPSRRILINDGTFESPVITGGGYENGVSSIYWEIIPSAFSYKVYSSPDPYADPATWTYETEVFTNECSISGQTDQKKFYFVTAVY